MEYPILWGGAGRAYSIPSLPKGVGQTVPFTPGPPGGERSACSWRRLQVSQEREGLGKGSIDKQAEPSELPEGPLGGAGSGS